MKILITIIILTAIPLFAQQDEECIFDQSTQTDEFIKTKGVFSNYVWDNDKKEATIVLDNGDVLKARRGGCVHFGMSGELESSDTSVELTDINYWFEKAMWIAQNILDQSDAEHLKNQISKKQYTLLSENDSIYVVIPHDSYDEFSISVRKEKGKVFVYVGYYFS